MGFGSFLTQSLKEKLGSWSNFSQGFKEGFFGADNLRDYQHASKTFVADGQALAPTQKFLFHVYFRINTDIPGLAQAIGGGDGVDRIGMLVKTAQLPSFAFDISELNQYNRKRYVQTKINYRPVTLTLHDDGSDTVRSMWFNYFNYYYNDPDYGYDGNGSNNPGYNNRDIYSDERFINNWGYDGVGPNGANKPAFFKDIKIYGLNRGNFTSYTLINPIISEFVHDTFDYSQTNGVMQHTITLNYETVKYGRGKVGSEVRGFGNPAMYDTTPSPLRPGTRTSLFGKGGILDAGNSILEDLASGNILGAIRTGGSLRNALKGKNVTKLITNDLADSAIRAGLSFLSNNGSRSSSTFSIPSFGSNFGIDSFGGNITQSAKGIFGQTSFDSLNSSLTNLSPFGFTNSFEQLTPSVNSLKNQFAPDSQLISDYVGLFKNLQSNIGSGLSVLENELSEVVGTTDTSSFPSITNLQNEIPGSNSLVDSLTETTSSISKSFAPVVESATNSFKSVVNSNEVQTLKTNLTNTVGDVFSNGSNISQ